MKTKLGNFLEVFGIVLGIISIIGFVILLIKGNITTGIMVLSAGICVFVFSLAISQILFSLTKVEEDTEMMSKRMEVLETINREAVSKDLFSGNPKKKVNQVANQNVYTQQQVQYSQPDYSYQQPYNMQEQNTVQQTTKMAACYKCGYQGPYNGNNFCPKCGNHSFYTDI